MGRTALGKTVANKCCVAFEENVLWLISLSYFIKTLKKGNKKSVGVGVKQIAFCVQ